MLRFIGKILGLLIFFCTLPFFLIGLGGIALTVVLWPGLLSSKDDDYYVSGPNRGMPKL